MNNRLKTLVFVICFAPHGLWAADQLSVSPPTGGIFKMVLGLMFVLAVMAFVTWLTKRMMPGVGKQQSAIKIVSGVSVGSRERVVVLEIAGRWLVVGVAPGQVNAIANLEKGNTGLVSDQAEAGNMNNPLDTGAQKFASFGQFLKKSASKFGEHTDANK